MKYHLHYGSVILVGAVDKCIGRRSGLEMRVWRELYLWGALAMAGLW